MPSTRGPEAPRRWLWLGLGALALLPAALLGNALATSTRGAAPARPAQTTAALDAPPASEAPAAASSRREALDADAVSSASAERVDTRADARIETSIQASAAMLLGDFAGQEFDDDAWKEIIQEQALLLGRGALPELRAILRDDGRSVEEHAAVSELIRVLEG